MRDRSDADDSLSLATVPGLYAELKELAHRRLYTTGAVRPIDTTALVHESWIKLAERHGLALANRNAFFAYAAKTMRSIIVDLAREAACAKRGAGVDHTALTDGKQALAAGVAPDLIDEALRELEQYEPRAAQIVEMRYFGGFKEEEIANVLGLSERTVRRDWEKAKLLLHEWLTTD